MTRVGKKAERRAQCPRKRKNPSVSTGPRKDNLPEGYKQKANAVEGDLSQTAFIGKVG